MAVSKTGDPVNGGWNFYSNQGPGGLGDYPKFGIWPDGIYMSANMFGYSASGSYFGFHILGAEQGADVRGRPVGLGRRLLRGYIRLHRHPANVRLEAGAPPAGSSEYFVSTEQFLNALSIYKFHVDWDKVSTSTLTGPFTSSRRTAGRTRLRRVRRRRPTADVLPIRAMGQAQYSNLGGAESVWVSHTVQRGLTYSSATSQYTYGWQTSAAWAGTCRQFRLATNDGTAPHTAVFLFTS